MRYKTGLVAALAVALLTITTNNVRGEAPSDQASPSSETGSIQTPATFDPLVPEITDVGEPLPAAEGREQ